MTDTETPQQPEETSSEPAREEEQAPVVEATSSEEVPQELKKSRASIWPILVVLSLVITFVGMGFGYVTMIIGLVLLIGCLIGWFLERR